MRTRTQEMGLVFERSLFYHCKNEMGLRRTYIQAPPSHDHPRKIAGHVLSFLRQGAEAELQGKPDRTVVTVPASFLLNQRRDTLEAAELAGLKLEDHDLLDEPTAALDLESVKRIIDLIKKIAKQKQKTILLVEHNLDVVRGLVENAYFMSDGEILAHGQIHELIADPKLAVVYFGIE